MRLRQFGRVTEMGLCRIYEKIWLNCFVSLLYNTDTWTKSLLQGESGGFCEGEDDMRRLPMIATLRERGHGRSFWCLKCRSFVHTNYSSKMVGAIILPSNICLSKSRKREEKESEKSLWWEREMKKGSKQKIKTENVNVMLWLITLLERGVCTKHC